MSESRKLLIRASAGTGKTFRLSGRFLALLFEGVAPERILATTFTRKAAGEILDRVLERLVEATGDDKKLAELAATTGAKGVDRETCLQLLASLTRTLHTFQVRTIDSFFVHLVRLFALDLELPSDWSICDERVDERLRAEALQDVLNEESAEELLLLLRELSKGGAGRSVQAKLMSETRALRPALLESTEKAWDSFEVPAGLDDKSLQATLTAIEQAELPTTAKGDPNKNWLKARDALLKNARSGQWEDIVTGGGLGAAYYSEEQTYHKKPFPDSLLEALRPLFRHVVSSVLGELRARNLAAHSLVETFETSFQAKKRNEGAFGFADLPHALAPRTAARLPIDERELDLWFRLDGRIDHLLLDEFQDTSPVQWRILAPIAEEITSEGGDERSFFCVGDVKQSIYSFRHAEPRLLADLQRMLPGVDAEEMDRSYRSSQIVLDTVNWVFSDLANNSAFGSDDLAPYRAACRDWSGAYRQHEAAKDIPGAVLMIEAKESEKPELALVDATVQRVARLSAEAPSASIGILLRRRKLIPQLIHRLREQGIDASGEGGTPLTDSRSVLCFLSLLHLADFPEDSAAAFHVATSPLGAYEEFTSFAESNARRELSRTLRRRLADAGLGEFCRQYASRVANDPEWSAWDKARFAQLLDQAFAFEGQGELRPSAFIDHVRAKNVEAPGGSSVRVMTIHASKGLEFDAVILPELAGKFANLMSTLHTYRAEPEVPFEKVTLAVKKKLQPISTELRELYEHNTHSAVEDSLCVLYVAMTRAARRLELIVPWQDPDAKVNVPDTHHVLRAALAAHGLRAEPDDDGVIWEHPGGAQGAGWCAGLEVEAPPADPESPTTIELNLAPSKGPRHLNRRSPSAEEGGGKKTAREALLTSRGADVGTLVHACMEELEWIEDFQFDAKALSKLPALRNADAALRKTALSIVEKAIESPAIRAALSRENCKAPASSDVKVLAEETFALTQPDEDGQDELWSGSIDRLVIAHEGDRVVHAEIIDYKTDNVEGAELETRVGFYAPQLRRYREVIALQTGLEASSIPARLLFLGTGAVVDVD